MRHALKFCIHSSTGAFATVHLLIFATSEKKIRGVTLAQNVTPQMLHCLGVIEILIT